MLLDVIHLQLEMMGQGIQMRGGITSGELCHVDNIVYGPAMVEAYELESKHAIYPRVVVDKKTIEVAVLEGDHLPNEELEYVLGLIEHDADGRYFVDFMSQWQEIDYGYDYFTALSTTKSVIQTALDDYAQDPKVLSKYIWLKDYYNNTLNKLASQLLAAPDTSP
ncbi:hypothetical protein [Virgibacillus sp. L01]|uniref:hypothetical protein n=1 Tax=Virgibacillus sp. L01 TaxID=3457429 RepID=UPI003FD1C5CD